MNSALPTMVDGSACKGSYGTMHGIVYVSRALVPFGPEELDALASRAAERNAELGVTGYLFFEKDRFIQYIEGEGDAVRGLMTRIEQDPRHEVLNQLFGEVAERRFPAWSMQRLQQHDLAEIRLERPLSDYLLFTAPAAHRTENWSDTVWRMVQTLSKFRNRLPMGR
jgi:hypothetical protein